MDFEPVRVNGVAVHDHEPTNDLARLCQDVIFLSLVGLSQHLSNSERQPKNQVGKAFRKALAHRVARFGKQYADLRRLASAAVISRAASLHPLTETVSWGGVEHGSYLDALLAICGELHDRMAEGTFAALAGEYLNFEQAEFEVLATKVDRELAHLANTAQPVKPPMVARVRELGKKLVESYQALAPTSAKGTIAPPSEVSPQTVEMAVIRLQMDKARQGSLEAQRLLLAQGIKLADLPPLEDTQITVTDKQGTRTLIVPAHVNGPDGIGRKVIEIEAMTATRLLDGCDALQFILAWEDFLAAKTHPSVTFAAFCEAIHPGKVSTRGELAQPAAGATKEQQADIRPKELRKQRAYELHMANPSMSWPDIQTKANSEFPGLPRWDSEDGSSARHAANDYANLSGSHPPAPKKRGRKSGNRES